MNHIQEVGIQSAYAKSIRLQKTFNTFTTFTELQKEWLAGRLLTSNVSNAGQKWYYLLKVVPKGWKPSCYVRFMKIVQEIQEKYGKAFPTGKDDDAPFPFHPSSIPIGKLPMIVH